ncbi:hypothetical protein PILCRDRAFT_53455, partial [Piloderma croceum F 1598]
WLYMLIVAMDANFRLQSCLRGLALKHPALSPGWAYFVDNSPYAAFIKDYVDDEEIVSCVGFQALLNMLTKKSKGLRATGLGAVSCARHQLFRALGMGDLQKGERFCNMDYIFTSSVADVGLRLITISYDVCCQWFIHFWTRMRKLPSHLQINLPVASVQAKVPKFHLQSHQEQCHGPFSFAFTKGVGHVDGEGVERNWDYLNGQGPSTKEMVPGNRWESLDDCCGHSNWRKTVGLGNLLLKRMLRAIPEAIRTSKDFINFDRCLREEDEALVIQWETELSAWMQDKSLPDPYRIPALHVTLAQVRLELAEEDKKRVEEGITVSCDVSASGFLTLGMDIQGQQELIRREVKGKSKQTLLQSTSLVERRTLLLKRIQRFREVQRTYMPGLDAPLLAQLEQSALPLNTTSVHVEDSILFMPSELPFATRRRVCNPGLSDIEDRLRFAEAHDALDHLRHHLQNRTFTNKFKVQNVTGQKHNTRAREVQNRIDDRVKTSQVQYCRARAAMVQLQGHGHWETTLQVLNQSDVRALNERELTEQEKDDERRVRARSGKEMEDSE